jgi:hypothetical protein
MKKSLFLVLVFFLVINTTFSQNMESPVPQMDEAVRNLARSIHAVLAEKRAVSLSIDQFVFQNNITPFSSYWINQLTREIVSISGRTYNVFSTGAANAEWTVTGEIVLAVDTVRIYTRLIRSSDRVIEANYDSSFQFSDIRNMLAFSGDSSGSIGWDPYEPDSWENPVAFTIGSSQNTPVMNRFLTEGDEDFFLLVPEVSGRLTVETTGSIDTYMYLFHYDTREYIAEDDDGGQGLNARIVHNVRAGIRYLAVVRGYSSSITGAYGFRAFIVVREGASSFEEPILYEIGHGDNVTSVWRNMQAGDEDYFLLIPARDGQLTIETTGRTDTYMELYNADLELLDEDDDSGENTNARIIHNVRAGNRYIALVRGYSRNTAGNYNFRAFFSD